MYVLDQLSVAPNRRLWTLVDTTTNLPLLFPLLFLIDRLSLRSESTQSSTLAGVDFAITGLMSEAKDELRLLGGWSHNSRMPELYARRFLSERANFSNVTRIAADSSEDEFFSSIHQVFRETIK